MLQLLNEQLIPRVYGDTSTSVMLAEPSYIASLQFQVTLHQGKPLSESKPTRSSIIMHAWPEQGLHSARYPCLLAVAEGEIDWRIGITQSTSQKLSGDWQKGDYIVKEVTEGSFFLMPSGTPHPDGSLPHWERSSKPETESTLFWMLILPSGILTHFCRGTATIHESCAQEFLPCPQILPLANMLEKELAMKHAGDIAVTRAVLHTILEYARRGLQQRMSVRQVLGNTAMHGSISRFDDIPQAPLQRAQEYIEANLAGSLNIRAIANHVYLSTRQLDRHFKRDLDTSIMDYVIMRRIEMAKVLLQDTDLPIGEIGQMVGYSNPSSFNQTFKRKVNMTPLSCRKISR